MRRLFFIAVMVIAAASLYADEKPVFNAGITGIVYSTAYTAVKGGVDGGYSALRLNPLMTFLKGGVEAVVELEYNATFGAESSADGDDSFNTGVGAGKKGVQVTQAYGKLQSDAVNGLFVSGGIITYRYPFLLDESVPMFSTVYKAGPVDINAYYMKLYEGDNNTGSDDVQVYGAEFLLKTAELEVRPAFLVNRSEKGSEGIYKDSLAYMPALSVKYSGSAFGINASAVYINGEDKIADTEYKAYAFDFAPYIKAGDAITLTGFITMVSGDADTSDGEDTSFLNATIDGRESGINSFRLYIIEDGGSFTENSDVAGAGKYSNTSGYAAAGLSAEVTAGALKTIIQGAYVRAHKVAAGQGSVMGTELDLKIEYQFSGNSKIFAEGAYLFAGDFYLNQGDKKQNASYINSGMTFEL